MQHDTRTYDIAYALHHPMTKSRLPFESDAGQRVSQTLGRRVSMLPLHIVDHLQQTSQMFHASDVGLSPFECASLAYLFHATSNTRPI